MTEKAFNYIFINQSIFKVVYFNKTLHFHGLEILSTKLTRTIVLKFLFHHQVQITLEDINDNAPEFGTTSVRVSVAESAAIGSVVYAARATDEDDGKNGQINYHLVSASGPSNTFAVNAQHGLVTLLRSVDEMNLANYCLAKSVLGTADLNIKNGTVGAKVELWHAYCFFPSINKYLQSSFSSGCLAN